MITYDKLWETMKEKQITQYRLIKYYGFSAGQIGRLKKNMYVSTIQSKRCAAFLTARWKTFLNIKQMRHSANSLPSRPVMNPLKRLWTVSIKSSLRLSFLWQAVFSIHTNSGFFQQAHCYAVSGYQLF